MGKEYRCNAQDVLTRVEEFISRPESRFCLSDAAVYEPLSIFDWWPEYLSKSKLYEMRQFLREAIKLGYTGYVCFKVGATGCANGMWAHTKECRPDGYSPDDCPILFRSFTPAYRYWDVTDKEGHWDWPGKYKDDEDRRIHYDKLGTIKQLEAFIEEHRDVVYRA